MYLILDDMGRNIGKAHAGLHKTVKKLIKEDYMTILKPYFYIEQFKTRTKKYVHFLTDGVSVGVVLDEEFEPKPRACKPKRKRGEEDDTPVLPSQAMKLGLD